jgi:hypothetical protein
MDGDRNTSCMGIVFVGDACAAPVDDLVCKYGSSNPSNNAFQVRVTPSDGVGSCRCWFRGGGSQLREIE